jgi:hypothetical protein
MKYSFAALSILLFFSLAYLKIKSDPTYGGTLLMDVKHADRGKTYLIDNLKPMDSKSTKSLKLSF